MIRKRLNILILTLTLFLIEIKSTKTTSFNCTENCYCTQSPDQGYDIFCPSIDQQIVKVSFDFDDQLALEIECPQRDNYMNYLPTQYLPPDTNMNLKLLRFKKCSLPKNTTIKDIMTAMKIQSTKALRITDSELKDLNRDDLKGLESVQTLEVTGNYIGNFTDDLIYDLNELEEIDIKSNFKVIPQRFFTKATNLKWIEISENFLPDNASDIFKNQRNLQQLNMWSMEITQLDPIFDSLVNLDTLDLSLNDIQVLAPKIFHNLDKLKVLSLRRNKFETLPLGLFDTNTQLEKINLSENIDLKELPENLFADKPNLSQVQLNWCNLTTLPGTLFKNSNALEELEVENNRLGEGHGGELPIQLLWGKTRLRRLALKNNYLQFLPYEFFKDLINLEYLNLNDNFIQLTSNNFEKQINLRSLHLSNNYLQVFNASCRNLKNLQKLDVSKNGLTLVENAAYDPSFGFYSVFADLRQLEYLNLKNNHISIMFTDWKILTMNLKELDLSYNRFTNLSYIDFEFGQNVIQINLENNLIHDIDMSRAEFLVEPGNGIPSYRRPEIQRTVYLNNNPINCGCNLYHLYRYFDQTMNDEVRFTLNLDAKNLRCQSPENMINITVEDIKSETFVCEYEGEMCPEIATCYHKPHDNLLTIDFSQSGLTNVPDLSLNQQNRTAKFKKSVVLLQGNQINRMPAPGMGYEKITMLDLSNNLIDNVSWVPENLEVLRLNDNYLTHLSDQMLLQFNRTNLRNLSLYNNPWTCNCSTKTFVKFIQDQFQKLDTLQNITCKDSGEQISDLSIDELCPLPTYVIIFICISVAIIGIGIAILTVLYNRFNMEIKVWLFAHQTCLWLVSEDEVDKDKIYDAFISYSHKDEDFIIPELIEKLEEGPKPYKLCLHFRNWQPGEFISRNIANSIADSRRTIVILSKNFLESEWGKMEFRVAHKQALEENRTRVIIILLGEIPMDNLDDEIKAYLNTNTYLKWGDPWFWKKLHYALPHSHVKDNDQMELIVEPTTPPILSTPPADKIVSDPLKQDVLNVKLINGTLVNGYVNSKLDSQPQLFGSNADLYDCDKMNQLNNKLNKSEYIIR